MKKNIQDIIAENSLCVRCLPHKVTSKYHFNENTKLKENQEIEIWKPDITYFETVTKNINGDPQKRMKAFYERFPNGRKFVVETKEVKNGGWWYVKEAQDTMSTVRFNRKYDKFFAPTLEEAIELYLKSKENG